MMKSLQLPELQQADLSAGADHLAQVCPPIRQIVCREGTRESNAFGSKMRIACALRIDGHQVDGVLMLIR